ncbi:hypothetical protein [Streptomyces sp. NPDC008092]|uniref:hypothetical protein n=1 Tax=Streptomyces sp. NPDC008092 TaxID=3364808 RepID=UPI0036E81475
MRATGTAPRAPRHCEQAGLITSARSADGYREYGAGIGTGDDDGTGVLGAEVLAHAGIVGL